MKKKSKIILIFIVFILIIISILFFVLFKYKEKNGAESEATDVYTKNEFTRTSDINLYYTIDECIKSYMTMLEINENEVLISYLNPDYINKNEITVENVLDNIQKYKDYDTYRTYEMYELQNESCSLYLAKGRIDRKNVYFSVGLDKNNETFEILPIDEKEYSISIQDKNIDAPSKEITKRKYNFIRYKGYTDEDISRLYFVDYIKLMLIDSEEAYNMLEQDYKKEKFETLENFKDYINKNKQNLELSYKLETEEAADYESFSKYYEFKRKYSEFGFYDYKVKQNNDLKQYACTDGRDNYYIFNVKYPGDYTVKLDKE